MEDFYTLYVEIVGISENIFWDMPIPFVKTVARNKQAYEMWLSYEREKIMEGR